MAKQDKHWDSNTKTYVYAEDVDAFIKDVLEVCKKHNISLSHEDECGAFIILRGYDDGVFGKWLRDAHIGIS